MLNKQIKDLLNFFLIVRKDKITNIEDFFTKYGITDPKQMKNYYILALCGIKKMQTNWIINYAFFEYAFNAKKEHMMKYLDQYGKRSFPNWSEFEIPLPEWDEDKVSEFLADLPDTCYNIQNNGKKVRVFPLIVHQCYKQTGEVITLERARSNDVRKAVNASDFSEEEWNAFDLIKDKFGDMNLVDRDETKNEEEISVDLVDI